MDARELEGRAWRMRHMMRRLDVDFLELAYADLGGEYEQARAACRACPSAGVCLRWLDTPEAADAPSFCPNLRRFARFMR